ncbi:MAG: DNA gyrase subunit A [Anaerolineales bacterium]|nr:MAG: DNA gyrase subunit A [Anaerolineales bacterium]
MDIGIIRQIDIESEMKVAYLDYAMSVIVARALPDARDGLKPVHRRILYAMHDMGIRSTSSYKKSARIVGEVLGKYHPHGDAAVYDAMARMAQDFSMRYLLVDGQGNFGSIDGDSPAAMRYTEARLARIAEELLLDIEKDTVDWMDNFDGSLQEPQVLPARLPNMLLNGTSGIAVGMATNIPPHNLGEICDAIAYLIDRYDEYDDVAVADLMQFVKGPDFPTGGLILGREGIEAAYGTGKGRVVMRAVARIEDMRGSRHRIVISEIPYQVNKAGLIEKIAELVRADRLKNISDLRDESDRLGLSIVIELKRGAQPNKVLNQLYKYTPLQSTFGVNMLALVDGEPRILPLKRALQVYIEHRRQVITRRTQFELEKARHRAHILEGLRIALSNLDAIIQTIRQSPDAEVARERLMKHFKLTEVQAQAILDMQLRRLAALERQKIEEEYAQLLKTIAYLENLLANPQKILDLVKEDVLELKEQYGDERRTRIVADATEDFDEEDLIPREEVLVSITQRGYVKRVPASTYRAQIRGGRGVTGMTTREEDAVLFLFAANSLDTILYFTDQGKVYSEKAYRVPDAGRTAKGIPIINLINLAPHERVTATVSVPDFEQADYLTMVTRQGRIKRADLSEFESVRPSGLIAINLDSGDELGWVKLTEGEDEVVVVTQQGQAIRFKESDVRPMGRAAGGVMAIKLADNDQVASMDVVDPNGDLLVVTARGYAKRTSLSEYSTQGRYGGGVLTLSKTGLPITGPVVTARVVSDDDEITLISAEGMVLRTRIRQIPKMGRATRGATVMRMKKGDLVVSLALIAPRQKPKSADKEPSEPED